MISTYKHNKVTWVDLENPNQEEILKIAEKYGLNPDVAHDLLSPTIRPVIEIHKDYIYLILHFPININKNTFENKTEIQEIDFIIGRDFIITNKYITFDSLIDFAKRFTVNSVLQKDENGGSVGQIFYKIIKGLYEEMENRLEYVNQTLQECENDIFNGNEKLMVTELSKLNRLILHFNKSIAIHEDSLKDLVFAGKDIFGAEDLRYFKNLLGEYIKVKSLIRNLRDYSTELRNTNDSLLTTKQNETMKLLTVVAFITFPMSVIANLFGMNTNSTPIVGLPHDFVLVILIMIVASVSMFAYFKIKKWL